MRFAAGEIGTEAARTTPGGMVRTPTLAGALRESAVDFYFNSWRLAPANLIWGVAFLAVMVAGISWPPAFALGALLAVPFAGLHRMAALLVRGEAASFSDFGSGMRRFVMPAAATGAAASLLAVVLTTNVVVGLQSGDPVGWGLATLALYGDIVLAMVLVSFWPILVDPRREGLPVRQRLRLAGLVVLARPRAILGLTAAVLLLLALSTVLLAALVMVTVAYVALVAARYVLPLADVLEERLASRRAP